MSKRYFISTPISDAINSPVTLDGAEAHHLVNVMRVRVGDEVTLFDGLGAEFRVSISKLDKRTVSMTLLKRIDISRESSMRLSIAVALPKGERQQWMCEKLTELGCSELVPIRTRNGVAEPGDAAISRLRRFVVEASKQCGRNHLMQIAPPIAITDYLASGSEGPHRLFLDGSGNPYSTASYPESVPECRVAIGPEGGWSEEEIDAARRANWQIVSLGPRILRIETAAIAIAARLCSD
jgi:16S rRNA (uracil1498-N3)-methyltransferase